MPVKIPDTLPAMGILESENIFVMGENRAVHQDIRPLRLAILNLMPTKIVTETQLLRLLGNSPLQVEIELLHMESHESKNTPAEHLLEHYSSFSEVKDRTSTASSSPTLPIPITACRLPSPTVAWPSCRWWSARRASFVRPAVPW